jgi:hypothetical protein
MLAIAGDGVGANDVAQRLAQQALIEVTRFFFITTVIGKIVLTANGNKWGHGSRLADSGIG